LQKLAFASHRKRFEREIEQLELALEDLLLAVAEGDEAPIDEGQDEPAPDDPSAPIPAWIRHPALIRRAATNHANTPRPPAKPAPATIAAAGTFHKRHPPPSSENASFVSPKTLGVFLARDRVDFHAAKPYTPSSPARDRANAGTGNTKREQRLGHRSVPVDQPQRREREVEQFLVPVGIIEPPPQRFGDCNSPRRFAAASDRRHESVAVILIRSTDRVCHRVWRSS